MKVKMKVVKPQDQKSKQKKKLETWKKIYQYFIMDF